ncbi:MAG: bifunctional folylpolyglutamate synthase/dihydrofolate synthase [Candidatus Omnitrophica bacterium]|nr:bifunctional folylpolyglutamate synthase/dihydrofolate synthase [Candidatus Omnitrophota bacterium]
MTYQKAQAYLNSFINYERLNFYPYPSRFKLSRVRRLLEFLGRPDQSLKVIHIAGSKGKGSTCAFLANILKAAGFKVGLYTSPHLVDIRERIRIIQKTEKEKISKKDFTRLVEKIKPYTEKLRKTKFGKLSFFEILTVLACLYFKEKNCDFVVLETGIGGRLDATNVVSSILCAITPISYEHTQALGKTLGKIAEQKAGIIKQKKQVVVTAPQRPAALRVISRRAKKIGAALFEVGRDIRIQEQSLRLCGQSFSVQGILGRYPGLKIKLLGRHQLVNAAVALGCAEALGLQGVKISASAIKQGLANTQWPGRLQIIAQRPYIVLDGAQNRASAGVLKQALYKLFKFQRLILVFGVSQDKDVGGMLKEFVPPAQSVILTKSQNPRALAPQIIKTYIKTNSRPIFLTENIQQALRLAREKSAQQDLILVTGSLFLIGEVLKFRG